jgi:hypothetical protein
MSKDDFIPVQILVCGEIKYSYIIVGNLEDKVHLAKRKNRWKQRSTYTWHQVA